MIPLLYKEGEGEVRIIKMTILYNKKELTIIRKKLRNNTTISEKLLWHQLRNKKLGVKFRRQYSLGRFVLDFYCRELRLAIEIDGATHETIEEVERDRQKENFISQSKINLIRYTNIQIKEAMENVIINIQDIINKNTPPNLPL